MAGESTAVETIRAQCRRGTYAEAAAYAAALSPEVRSRPSVALERARALARQGRMSKAKDALAEADSATATPAERLLLSLEMSSLRVYCDVAIRAALAEAEAAFAACGGASVAEADRAEAERVRTRIILTASIYFEVDAGAGRHARDRLPVLAETLERAGRIDESLAALLTYAERLEENSARVAALEAVAARAVKAGRPGLAGEARLMRAEQMLVAGAPGEAVRAELDAAGTLFKEAGHAHGPTDVRRVCARLAVERELAAPDVLAGCLEEYQRLDLPRGALSLLMDLSQLEHERGDTARAADYRRQSLRLAEEVGMGLVRDGFQLAQADLLMRGNDFGAAVELCSAALAADPPRFSAASYKQLMASAYAFVEDYEQALDLGRQAFADFERLGAAESASNAAMKLAADLTTARSDGAWDEAEALLKEWAGKDETRGDIDSAVSKRELLAQIHLNRFFFSPIRRGQSALLDAAEEMIAAAERLAARLPPRDAAKRVGNLRQMRGQLYQARGDNEGVERAWREALAVYEPAGLAMEAANCRYMIGVLRLNRANEELLPHFGESESNLRGALEYYERAGMRGQAADTRFMFARLYVNAAARVQPDLGAQMLDAALGHLAAGEADYDAVRREYAVGTVLEAMRGKRALTAKSRRIYDLALEILALRRPDPAEAWHWTQRAKARALADALGGGAASPARVLAALARHPDSSAVVGRERELVARLAKSPPGERLQLRSQLSALRAEMAADPHLADYLELRTGAAVERDDLEAMLSPDAEAGRACVCADWVSAGERLFLLTVRPGSAPQLTPLTEPLGAARDFVRDNLSPQSFRSTLRDSPEMLRELDWLVAPLAHLSAPGELLVLSPTGPLHALPLHALEIGGEPLLARNPVVYTPSLGVLRQCLARRRDASRSRTAALFGDPSGDRQEAAALVADLAARFGTVALTGTDVTRAAFGEAVAERDLVHFQGHAVHDRNEPLDSHLVFSDARLSAREVFDLPGLSAELVTLAACESAASVIAAGDEPLGLIPAFLYAGAGAVLATLWRVNSASAAHAMRLFYDALAGEGEMPDKARALRAAALAVRAVPRFSSPYYWAPFALYGDWH